jgi:hypothetical protein
MRSPSNRTRSFDSFQIDWMFSSGHASTSFSYAVIFSRPRFVDHPLYTCLASSRLALLKPEPYVVRLYRRPTLPTEFLPMVGF